MDFKRMVSKYKKRLEKKKRLKALKKKQKIKSAKNKPEKRKIAFFKTAVKYVKVKSTLYRVWMKKNTFVLLRTFIFLAAILIVAGLLPDAIDPGLNEYLVSGSGSVGETIVSLISSVLFISGMLTQKLKSLTYNDLNDDTRQRLSALGYKPTQLDLVEDGLELFIGSEVPEEEHVFTSLLNRPEDDENMIIGTKRVVEEFIDITTSPVKPIYKEPKKKKKEEKNENKKSLDNGKRRGGPIRRR
jgi:hypothetical protein